METCPTRKLMDHDFDKSNFQLNNIPIFQDIVTPHHLSIKV
jgi:hypothetical protein